MKEARKHKDCSCVSTQLAADSSSLKQKEATMNIEQLVEELESSIPEFVSPYRLAKIVSAYSRIEPQMIYSYCSQKKADGSTRIKNDLNALGKKQIHHDEAVSWSASYLSKKLVLEAVSS